jgi:hypothetical protein
MGTDYTLLYKRGSLESLREESKVMTAHVNEQHIVLRFASIADNLSHDQWESLLDELKSHPIPSLYRDGERSAVSPAGQGVMQVTVYFTPQTVTMDESIPILKKWNIEVFDVRQNANPSM